MKTIKIHQLHNNHNEVDDGVEMRMDKKMVK